VIRRSIAAAALLAGCLSTPDAVPPPDADVRTCEERYLGQIACASDDDGCEVSFSSEPGETCEARCAAGGQRCAEAWDRAVGEPCTRTNQLECRNEAVGAICVCVP
jgi:hypothetical protein